MRTDDRAGLSANALEEQGRFVYGNGGAVDLRTHLEAFWRRKWVVLACIVALPAAAYLVSLRGPELYQSSALVQVNNQTADDSLFGYSQSADQSLTASARRIRTTEVARAAARRLRPRPRDPAALLGQISSTPDEESGFITITASDADPRRAAAIANSFVAGTREVRTADTRAQITTAIVRLQQALAGADPDDRQEMLGQLRRLRALRAAEGNSVEVIEPARVSAVPISPQRRNILLGLVLGALIAIGLVFLLERIDRRVREVEELEQLTGVPLLAVVPDNAMNGAESSPTTEAFQTLRASLTYFNIDRKLESVVICSSVKGEGKTTVAVNLARAVARTGKEVILLDCDLRQPMVSERMRTPGESGLGHVLSGEESIEEALSEVEVESGRLRVLASRRVPPNPSELIASERMSWLLTQVSAMSDLVVVDAPPALQVSDAVPLFRQVSGVVLIGRIDTTTRQAVRRLVSVVETAGGSALGVVATGVRATRLYGYGYGEYGATNGDATSKPRAVSR